MLPAKLAGAPEAGVDGFQVAAEPTGVEQRAAGAVGSQALLDLGQAGGVACQRQRQRFVRGQRIGDQLAQAHTVQQTARHTGREGLSHVGHHRQARHQRVGSGGVGVIGVCVEEQVGLAVARQVSDDIDVASSSVTLVTSDPLLL